MATISPFRAIHPNPFYADQLVFTKPQAESVAGDSRRQQALPPLKTLLETGARKRPETPQGQALAFREINETLDHLLESERLWLDQTACIYVYEVSHPGYRQSGIWTLTDLDEPIKTHELTFDDSVRRIKNYREQTGLEGSPILLTYAPEPIIDRVIAQIKEDRPEVCFANATGQHRLWKIENRETMEILIRAFAGIKAVYLADGHHRKRSGELLLPRFKSISALYMSTAELRISPYNRIVIPGQPVNPEWLFEQLLPHFYLQESFTNKPVQPCQERKFGMYFQGSWYHLIAKPNTYINGACQPVWDVSILQDYIFSRLFQITDPATDQRLKYAGGERALAAMETHLDEYPQAIGFTLCPMTTEQLCKAADMGINLPPKSTWIDPKVPFGLLLHRHQTQQNGSYMNRTS